MEKINRLIDALQKEAMNQKRLSKRGATSGDHYDASTIIHKRQAEMLERIIKEMNK